MSDNTDANASDEAVSDGGAGAEEATPQQAGELGAQTGTVTYGESVTDIFSRPDTKPILIQTVAVFAALGIGFGLFGYFAVDTLVGDPTSSSAGSGAGAQFGAFGGAIAALMIVFISSLAGPIVSITTSIRTNGMLAHLKDDLTYATGAVSAAIGQAVLLVITIFLSLNPIPEQTEIAFGDFTSLIALSVLVTGIVAGISMYVLRSLDDPVVPE